MASDPSAPRSSRAHLRSPIDVFVRIVGADRDYAFRTRDVSAGGLFLYTRVGHLYPFKVGATLTVELLDGERVISVGGEVIRCVQSGTSEAEQYPAGFAVRLMPLTDEETNALQDLIDRHRFV
jgi:hypothetical protein